MIKFNSTEERDRWYGVVKAALKGGRWGQSNVAEFVAELADSVLEEDRKRRAKLAPPKRKKA